MKTVCHVITKLELGGAQEVALYAVSHLDPARFRSMLVAGPGGLLIGDAKSLSHVDVTILPALGRDIRFFGDLAAFLQLYRCFKTHRPAVVHTHSSKAGILGRWAAWLAGVPVIVHTIHGYGITPNQPPWVRRCFIWLERLTGLITSQWIAVSHADMAQGFQWGLFSAGNVSVVRPGIDPRPYETRLDPDDRAAVRAEFGAGPQDWLVGSVACFKPQKAPADFLAVAKQVCEAIPQARFVLVGDGELRPHIERLIKTLNLDGRLCLAGWRRDIPRVMQAFDAFLLTSHWEGLPRVLLEARTVGLPTVATNVGGSAEAVSTEMQGWLSQAGDTQQLAQHLCEVYRASEANQFTPRVQTPPLPQEFHLDEMVKQYEYLYDRLDTRRERKHGQGTVVLTP